MPINEKLTHIHPSAVAIFVPGFGDEFTGGEAIVAQTVEGFADDISSVQLSMTVRNNPGTFSLVLQDDQNKFIEKDDPDLEIPNLYESAEKRKRSILAYHTRQDGTTTITDTAGNIQQVYPKDALIGKKQDLTVRRQAIYDYIEKNIYFEITKGNKYQELLGYARNATYETGEGAVKTFLTTEESSVPGVLAYEQDNPEVLHVLNLIAEYEVEETKTKNQEKEINALSSGTSTIKAQNQPPSTEVYKPSDIDMGYGNYYEHSSYDDWCKFASYVLIDISPTTEGAYKSYPTQYIRNNGGSIIERWVLLDDSAIVFIARNEVEETTFEGLFNNDNEIETTFLVSPYEGSSEERLFRVKRVLNTDLTESYRDTEEQGVKGFKKGRCKIKAMDRVVIFLTPRYDLESGELNQNNKGDLIRAFTGVVNTVQQGYSNGHHQITIQGEDVTKYMRISIINVNPALDLNRTPDLIPDQTEPINIWSDILLGLTTPEIIRLVTLGTNALKVKGTALNQNIDGIGWYKFAEGQGSPFDIVWESSTQKIKKLTSKKGIIARYDFSQMLGELFRKNSVHIIDPYRPNGIGLQGFRPYELSIQNSWSFYQADFKTRREIAYKAAEDSHFNFYADRSGHIWFHPYRFDTTWIHSAPNPKVYVIQNASIVSYGFVEDDSNIFTSVYASTEPDYGMSDLAQYGFYRGAFKDEGAMLRYGQRIFVATNPIVNTKMTSLDSLNDADRTLSNETKAAAAVTMYAKSLLQRILAGKYQGQITITGRPEIEPGRPVYIPIRNMVYYVESIDHNLTFGQNFETTLHLSYGRKPWEYLPELITFSNNDDIYAQDAYTFRQKAYELEGEDTRPPDERIPRDLNYSTDLTDRIAWGANSVVSSYGEEFLNRVMLISQGLGINPSWLMSCMAFETAETFNPAEPNRRGSGAIGLIQFMPSTARELGTTTEALAEMSAHEQLLYVDKYFKQNKYAGRMYSLYDVYMAILWPAAIGKSEEYVLFVEGDAGWNAGNDVLWDGESYDNSYPRKKVVTKRAASVKVQEKHDKGLRSPNVLIIQ